MALGIYFAPRGMSASSYDEVIQELDAAGAAAPAGRSYHCAFETQDGLHVFDVWESQESFDAFGQTLMPILASKGIDLGEPVIAEVHNVVTG